MAKKSIAECIATNDFEEAKERYNTTSNRWANSWWEALTEIYRNSKEWAKKYILDEATKTIKEVVKKVSTRLKKYAEMISLNPLCGSTCDEAEQKCYLIEFFSNGVLVCSKVGTTTRTVYERIKEELRSKTYSQFGIDKVVIDRVYDCGTMPAEGLESFFRSMYIKKYPNSFQKNDRFMFEVFDLEEADRLAAQYLGCYFFSFGY